MAVIPQRELRNDVAAVLARAEAGERLVVTVSGRPVAELGPVRARREVPAGEARAALARLAAPIGLLDDLREAGGRRGGTLHRVRALLDTSVLIDGIPDEVEIAAISVVSIAELQFGVERAAAEHERQRRLAWLGALQATFDPYPVDLPVALAWGRLAHLAAERGRQPRRRPMDLLIAATASLHGLVLLTQDEDLLWLGDALDVRRPA